ncbi:MAG: hypothetical protein HYZ45_13190, partial [Burkholderiales bacterium]|nr:hypothetical protein [Burkholderiales bacterium]
MHASQFSQHAERRLQQCLIAAALLPICLLILGVGFAFELRQLGLVGLLSTAFSGTLVWFTLQARREWRAVASQLQQKQQQQHAEFTQQLQQQADIHAQQLAQQLTEQHAQQKILHDEQLKENSLLISHLTEQVPGALFQLRRNSDGQCAMPYASLAIQELFAVSPDAICDDASALLERIHADDLALFKQDLSNAEHALERDLRVKLPGNLEGWRTCHARAQREEDGSLLWHGIFMDITERQQQAEDIKQANARADAASQAKSAYLENMTHEIRTPMNIILGMSYLTMETELAPVQRDYLENIRISAEHLLSLINDILDLSKIEAGLLEVETIEFDLHDTVAKLCKLMHSKITDKGLRFETHIDKATPHNLRGDPLRVSQVLINFIANAIKFTQHGSISLHIHCQEQSADAALLAFEVRDTGIGMTEKECSRMFQQFQQADASISRKYGGTGLGLAISKQLVELM